MPDIIKTWPACVEPKIAAQIFSRKGSFARYYFTLGRGKPKQQIDCMWFTYRGRIVGSFIIEAVVCNDGSLPTLKRLSEPESDSAWQIAKDAWVAICVPGCWRSEKRVFMTGFRGWRYFDYESYRGTPEARCRI